MSARAGGRRQRCCQQRQQRQQRCGRRAAVGRRAGQPGTSAAAAAAARQRRSLGVLRCSRQRHRRACTCRSLHRALHDTPPAPHTPPAACRGQSEEECPHYTNLSFELFSWEHIKRLRLANTCGDASPDPLAPEEGDGVEDGSIVPDDVSTAADGGEDGEAPPAPDGGSQLVQPSSRVLGDGGAATRPFTPGREPEPPQP